MLPRGQLTAWRTPQKVSHMLAKTRAQHVTAGAELQLAAWQETMFLFEDAASARLALSAERTSATAFTSFGSGAGTLSTGNALLAHAH